MANSILTKNKQHLILFPFIAFVVIFNFTACKKDKNTAAAVTEEEAVEVITQAVSAQSGGLSSQTEIAARTATESTLACNDTKDTSFSGASEPGAAISYSYSSQASTQMICENGVPAQFDFEYSGENSYSAPRMSSDDTNTAAFTISGLKPMDDQLIFNETYVRNGTQQSKVRLQRSFASKLTVTSTNIAVDKETSKIVSGIATVSFEGHGSDGATVIYGATLTFLGNERATLLLNNGMSYTIQW